jgi:hypothetical protein
LAAVLTHEIAHVTCKHVGKKLSLQISSMVSKELRKEVGGKMFQASFTTVQEDEADRVGLLYMALAGYNPSAAQKVWMRAHEKYGSDPGDYTYDHSLNIDRLKKISELIPIAMRYYKGDDIKNEDYDRLRVENDLIPRMGSFAEDSGLLTLLEAVLGTYSDYLNAKNEELSRRLSMQQDQIRIMQNARIINFKIADTVDGYRGVFGKVQNIGNYIINSVEITLYYYNAFGNVIYSEVILLGGINLWPGYAYDWGTYLKAIAGMQRVGATITKIYFAN